MLGGDVTWGTMARSTMAQSLSLANYLSHLLHYLSRLPHYLSHIGEPPEVDDGEVGVDGEDRTQLATHQLDREGGCA